jgi:hypothetical protein
MMLDIFYKGPSKGHMYTPTFCSQMIRFFTDFFSPENRHHFKNPQSTHSFHKTTIFLVKIGVLKNNIKTEKHKKKSLKIPKGGNQNP